MTEDRAWGVDSLRLLLDVTDKGTVWFVIVQRHGVSFFV